MARPAVSPSPALTLIPAADSPPPASEGAPLPLAPASTGLPADMEIWRAKRATDSGRFWHFTEKPGDRWEMTVWQKGLQVATLEAPGDFFTDERIEAIGRYWQDAFGAAWMPVSDPRIDRRRR